jgi:hypothetical protein
MENLDSFAIPMAMGDWVLIMESAHANIARMKAIDPDVMDEDDLSDMYADQQNLEGLLRYMMDAFEKQYGTAPKLG